MKNKTIGAYIDLVATVLGLAAMVIYLAMGGGSNFSVTLFLVLALVCGAAYFFVDHPAVDALGVLALVFTTIALCKYLIDSIAFFMDFFNGITMFGSSGSIEVIISILALMGISALGHIAAGFLKRSK